MKQRAEELDAVQQQAILKLADQVWPRVLPVGWNETQAMCLNWRAYEGHGLKVIVEIELHENTFEGASIARGGHWMHVSFSRPTRVPNYAETKAVKALFIGHDRKAIMIFPAEGEHVNIHPHCLHLFSPLDADPLPDFRFIEGGI